METSRGITVTVTEEIEMMLYDGVSALLNRLLNNNDDAIPMTVLTDLESELALLQSAAHSVQGSPIICPGRTVGYNPPRQRQGLY
jgi:hypothetical protein